MCLNLISTKPWLLNGLSLKSSPQMMLVDDSGKNLDMHHKFLSLNFQHFLGKAQKITCTNLLVVICAKGGGGADFCK